MTRRSPDLTQGPAQTAGPQTAHARGSMCSCQCLSVCLRGATSGNGTNWRPWPNTARHSCCQRPFQQVRSVRDPVHWSIWLHDWRKTLPQQKLLGETAGGRTDGQIAVMSNKFHRESPTVLQLQFSNGITVVKLLLISVYFSEIFCRLKMSRFPLYGWIVESQLCQIMPD